MATTVKQPNYITLGAGLLQFQTYTTVAADQFMKLIDFGAVKDIKIKTERTKAQFKDGTPQMAVVEDVTEEKATIEVILGERSPEEKLARLGAGTLSSVSEQAGQSGEEYKTLTGTAYEALECKNGTSIVVTSQDATPVTYSLTSDYTVGTKEGCDAIARVEGGRIEDGEQVVVTYTWDIPAHKKITFGGTNASTDYHMRHIKQLRDGKRIFTDFWKVSPAGTDEDSFLSNDYGTTTATFSALGDSSKSEGSQIYEKRYETA